MKKIIYTDKNNGVLCVVHPTLEALSKRQNLDEDAALNEIALLSVPPNTDFRIINESELPLTRESRPGWIDTGAEIVVDENKLKSYLVNQIKTNLISEQIKLDAEKNAQTKIAQLENMAINDLIKENKK